MTAVEGLKDDRLAALAATCNVAQFVSISPEGIIRHSVLRNGVDAVAAGDGVDAAVATLLAASGEASVNVRTFRPGTEQGNPFVYGLRTPEDAAGAVRAQLAAGFYVIVNETVDVHDGGVSGVLQGGVAEFAPDDTPRAVEGSDSALLPAMLADRLLRAVYSADPLPQPPPGERIEFSLHPRAVGRVQTRLLVWEAGTNADGLDAVPPPPRWPNRFSRLLGDKTFGLLLADAAGLPVPNTTVINRRVPPFRFGNTSADGDVWLRTCPAEQQPGRFTTVRGWIDPYELLAKEDPLGDAIPSVLAQAGVRATWSGATAWRNGELVVEGVAGAGDVFMLGERPPERLPERVRKSVVELVEQARPLFGPVRIEWAYDGARTWVLQMHAGDAAAWTVAPGEAHVWVRFDPAAGLEALRAFLGSLPSGAGIEFTAPVGLTSHLGDLLRKAGLPARVAG